MTTIKVIIERCQVNSDITEEIEKDKEKLPAEIRNNKEACCCPRCDCLTEVIDLSAAVHFS
jgi:hypothetical protein